MHTPVLRIRPLALGLALTAAALAALAVFAAGAAQAQEKVVFATNWKAEAGHGGFYQALADGTYKKYGLDVDIQQGGPMVNNRPMLPAGKVDFLMAGNLLQSFDNVKNGVPTVVVAAFFQKDPQAMFAHPGQGYDSLKDMAKAPVAFIGKDGQFSFWQWMKSEHGFTDAQLKPYTFNVAPFLADKRSVQQGYAISEPLSIKEQAGFDPVVQLLADSGFSTYSTTIETRAELIKSRPETVRKFIEASIIGWNNYLYGDNKAANALIARINPDASPAALQGSIALIKKMGIVDSGDSLTRGIGALDEARVKDFYDKMVKAGLYKPGEVDLAKVVTTQFVNKGVGLDLRKKFTGH
ncbi:ABC transporter substrate-binding protein [Verminephrobacter eiseniae]|uniref:ABC transporter substrate-binding protein n=1 Tax=Verminephrobacter eiseniae TaxID=364317 RepID=UPI0022389577|nr:ABC transporter substrate-binding protein [Verminephrobacter eiseniae]MCW5231551.1 ABC transporter substrate-binding protein [Verminephrobacter eiseniae]MCW5293280.1 ABC transporter substrate-binding protein [Verminephrobacter eiseniae]MCW8187250.1 ABC transporter substrate-binding protein [Verminephrobacter eiseniae]MCW8225363.1 ABC transporter substrate-binding protein [Verminephrobacter eiseniae]MCW8235979.1 ABC transporter substrate-binding protein [Verminephrobacter eiseniae]